ncbi:hypothetical protein BX616_005323, partial [Lobosporangium transversale]
LSHPSYLTANFCYPSKLPKRSSVVELKDIVFVLLNNYSLGLSLYWVALTMSSSYVNGMIQPQTSLQSPSPDVFCCEKCSKNFATAPRLKAHFWDYHSTSLRTKTVNSKGAVEEVTVLREKDGTVTCPRCSIAMATCTGLRRHLQKRTCVGDKGSMEELEEEELESDELEEDGLEEERLGQEEMEVEGDLTSLEPVTVPATFLPPPALTQRPSPAKRSYEDAVLSACQLLDESDDGRIITMALVRKLGLTPFSLKDPLGAEHCALANLTTIGKLSGDPSITVIPEPKKHKVYSKPCESCSPAPANGLENLLAMSPYAEVLRTRSFVELNEQHCKLLNREWTLHRNLRYVCARLLAGSIILKGKEAVMANTVEVYSRNRELDAHRENKRPVKGEAPRTSIPPPTGLFYDGVMPITVSSPDGERLVIGTQSCNFLVTSILRLDTVKLPSLGGTAVSFRLAQESDSKAARIYLDQESVKHALELNSDIKAWSVLSEDPMSELRQLRSKFHDPSTYLLCRAAGPFTRSRTCQPYTIFTVASCERFRMDGKGYAGSTIFSSIGQAVLCEGAKGCLKRGVVEKARQLCGNAGREGGNITMAINNIMGLFEAETDALTIIGNIALNKQLEVIAKELSGQLVKANEHAQAYIKQVFKPNASN